MYLDVDGVIVVWNQEKSCIELSRGFGELMRFCKLHDIQPFWLTMWSMNVPHLEGLGRLLWPDICSTMAMPEIINVDGLPKATYIDYESDFVWIEDGIGDKETRILKEHDALDRFFWTDGRNPNCLHEFMEFTRQRMGLPEIKEWKNDWEPGLTSPKQDMFK